MHISGKLADVGCEEIGDTTICSDAQNLEKTDLVGTYATSKCENTKPFTNAFTSDDIVSQNLLSVSSQKIRLMDSLTTLGSLEQYN